MKSTLFLVNIVLTTKVKKLQEEIEDLKEKIRKYEAQAIGNISLGGAGDTIKKKRKRKTKDQVERNFSCNIDNCTKSYGSENSLNQHMKLKHTEFWLRIKEKEQSLAKSTSKEPKKKSISGIVGEKRDNVEFKSSENLKQKNGTKQVVITQQKKILNQQVKTEKLNQETKSNGAV